MPKSICASLLVAWIVCSATSAIAAPKSSAGGIESGSCSCVGGSGWCHLEGLPLQCLAGKYPDGSNPCTGSCQIVPDDPKGGHSIYLKGNGGTSSTNGHPGAQP